MLRSWVSSKEAATSKPSKRKWIELDILTEQGTEALKAGKDVGMKAGQVLKFDYEGSETWVKLTRLDRHTGKVWGQEVQLYTPDEVEVKDAEGHSYNMDEALEDATGDGEIKEEGDDQSRSR